MLGSTGPIGRDNETSHCPGEGIPPEPVNNLHAREVKYELKVSKG